MCKCTPHMRTPYCGIGNCQWPEPDDEIDIEAPTQRLTPEREQEIREWDGDLYSKELLAEIDALRAASFEAYKLFKRISDQDDETILALEKERDELTKLVFPVRSK